MWRTHRESNPELTLRRGLFYPLNYECKLRILRKLVNDMAFSKTLPKTLPIFYSVVKNARYLAFFGLKSPIFAHFCWIHLALRSPSQMPKLYAKCPFLFIFVRFMQYFSSILHNILLFKWWFLCLFVGSKTETLPKYYQFSQKIGYPRHIETPVFTRGK